MWLIIFISIVISTGIESDFDEFFVILASLISVTFLVMAVIGSIGLLRHKKIGRTISIIIAVLMSIIPISMLIGIPMLIYLLRSEVREYFELSEEQKRQINSQQHTDYTDKHIGHKRLSVSSTGTTTWNCSKCNALISQSEKACPNCRAKLE